MQSVGGGKSSPRTKIQCPKEKQCELRGVDKTERNSEFSWEYLSVTATSNKDLTIHRSLFTVHCSLFTDSQFSMLNSQFPLIYRQMCPQLTHASLWTQRTSPHPEHDHFSFSLPRKLSIPDDFMTSRFSIMLMPYFVL